MISLCQRKKLAIQFAGFAIALGWLWASYWYSLSIAAIPSQVARKVLSPIYSWIYHGDLEQRDRIISQYYIGPSDLVAGSVFDSWRRIELSGVGFTLIDVKPNGEPTKAIPFVYESPDEAYLVEFKKKYALSDVIKNKTVEYDAMLALGSWLGTRWDHGTDPVVGTTQVCDPVALVVAGAMGAKFWCEIAARTAAHAFMSLGWNARVITASRDGYTWEHALTEVWSNQFNKWFVLDTDFNVVYERDGVPLSAYELMRDGEALQRMGKLVRREIAPPKPSLPYRDLIPFFRYIHLDLRNDWCSRHLRPGSPAGGDLATWWTARPGMNHLLTSKIRVDDPALFDWKLNNVVAYGLSAEWKDSNQFAIRIGLNTYSPFFRAFELRVDGQDWSRVHAVDSFLVGTGEHTVDFRLVTAAGFVGPVTSIKFAVKRTSLVLNQVIKLCEIRSTVCGG